MPTLKWVGKQIKRAKKLELTIGSSTVGHTFITTIGGTKAVTYVAVAGDTTVTITSAILDLLQDETSGEFSELTFAEGSTTSKIYVTGPDDGAPITVTLSGTGTYTQATLTANTSPFDVADTANYDTVALPGVGDTLVVEDSDIPLLYNLASLVNAFTFIRKRTHTGQIGLPTTSVGGYPEYRATHLELAGTSVTIETGADLVGSIRIKSTGAASTYTIQGTGAATIDAEPVEVYNTAATSVVRCIASGVAFAPLSGQAGSITTLTGEQSSIRVGSGATLVNATFKNCSWRVGTSLTTLTQLEGGNGEVEGSAACGNSGLKLFSGYCTWTSTGATGNSPLIGAGAVLDFTNAPAAVTVGGTVSLGAGGSFLDPRNVCGAYVVNLLNCRLQEVGFAPGTNRVLTVS